MNYKNNKLNRYSIRKYSIGVASVFVGMAFLGTPVLADQVSSASDVSQETALSNTVETVISTEVQDNPLLTSEQEEVKTEVVTSEQNVVDDETVAESKVDKNLVQSGEVVTKPDIPASEETEIVEKISDPTNPEGKKTVGYAAANIDKPETSIVNDVTRVRAVKKDGKLVTTDEATVTEDGHTALLATGNSGVIGDDYPSYWRNPRDGDSWGYAQANCTSFVAHRLHNINHFEIPRAIGNAGDWGANARALGYRVDSVPAIGSVAWSLPYTGGALEYGHVSWVAAIKGDNILVEEYNRINPLGYDTYEMPISSISGFIHFKDLAGGTSQAPSTPAPAQNQGTPASGVYHFTGRAGIKAEPKMSSPELAYYNAGQSVNYDRKLEADGHEWISYLSFAGNRRYIPIREIAKPKETVVKGTINVTNMDVVNGSFDVVISNVSSNKGLKQVSVPIWTEKNGQDDIIWYNAERQSNGTYKVAVNNSKHKNERGLYTIHLYYVLGDGELKGVGGTQTTLGELPHSEERKLSGKIRIENKRVGEFDVVVSDVYNPGGVKEVKLPTWSNVNGQDDIIWYKATRQADGTYRQHVKASDHKNSSGEYSIHLYYVQNDDTLQGAGVAITNVQVGTPKPNIPSSGVYRFTSYAAIRPEPRMSSAELAHYDAGGSVNYDRVLTADGHAWISYISYSGNRRYIAIN